MTDQIEQGTPEWFDLKRGKIGASHMADVMMKEDKAGYRNYMAQLVLERFTGKTEDTYESYDMKLGKELEPLARQCYEFLEGVEIVQVPWVDHPTCLMAGCSPDGLVGEDGLIEIKCFNAANHLDILRGVAEIDRKYLLQGQWQLATTERQWVDFCFYNPMYPEHLQLKVVRVWRDEQQIDDLTRKVVIFNAAVERMLEELMAL